MKRLLGQDDVDNRWNDQLPLSELLISMILSVPIIPINPHFCWLLCSILRELCFCQASDVSSQTRLCKDEKKIFAIQKATNTTQRPVIKMFSCFRGTLGKDMTIERVKHCNFGMIIF